jgi:hypothetical protein
MFPLSFCYLVSSLELGLYRLCIKNGFCMQWASEVGGGGGNWP